MTVVLLVLLPSVRGATPEEMFAAPPPEAHVGVWWHWMGGQVSREVVCEEQHSLGRPDSVVKTEKAIYVVEFKYGQSADAALAQCRERR